MKMPGPSATRSRPSPVALVLVALLTACRRAPAPREQAQLSAERSRTEADDWRDALVTLGALEAAAALEATDDERGAMVEYGLFELVANPKHPLRAELAAHVRSWPTAGRRRALDFFLAHRTFSTLYAAFAVETFGPPPGFATTDRGPATVRNAPALFGARQAFSELLRWAYDAGRVRELVRVTAARWESLQFTTADVERRKTAVLDYLGFADRHRFPRFDVVYDPFLREFNGYGSNPNDDRILLLVGPTSDRRDAEVLLVHEFTHFPMNLVFEDPRVARSLEDVECADRAVLDHRSYDGFRNYVGEALVRSISYRIAGAGARDTGFLFEPFFNERLPAYEAAPRRRFADWAPDLFRELGEKFCAR